MSIELPIVEVLPALRQALREHRSVVLQAPPGAGKSTGVPLALLDEPWMRGKRLVMLEPRRLATRAVSARMAQTLGEPVGRTVGYRMRLDTKVSATTRIEVVTEGVLAALLQEDPALERFACVIFDEFHERSLQADLGLALTLDVQANLNEELRLLVMSATLAAEPVAELIGDAPIVRASGHSYPVETRHVAPAAQRGRGTGADAETLTRRTTAAVLRALREEHGDALVFLPGAAEIRRVEADLRAAVLGRSTAVLPLMGELTQEEQDRAIRPSAPGHRKIVLATNIAETGLTIEGVRVVVDSGFARRPRFDPASGMSQLDTLRISRASADQRRGRAGRVAPGVCYRLWSAGTDQALEAFTPAEILEADLAPLALELAGWNVTSLAALKWLDPPPAAAYAQACDLLRTLGALDVAGHLTAHGREMLRLRAHPRLAHMLLRSRALRLGELACDVAALLGERDLLRRRESPRDADVRTRLDILRGEQLNARAVDRSALERTRRMAAQLRRQLDNAHSQGTAVIDGPDQVGVLLALAYPDRIARSREVGSGRYLLSNGRGAYLEGAQSLARSEFLAVAEVAGAEREARIFLAAPLSRAALEASFAAEIVGRERVSWNSRERAVQAVQERLLGSLVVDERATAKPDAELTAHALLAGIRELGIDVLPWERDTRNLQARVRFVAALPKEQGHWPDLSDQALLAGAEQWLGPRLAGMTRIQHLARLDLLAALEGQLDFRQRRRLEELAPTHLVVPSRSRIRIDYLEVDAPSLSAKVQELFGMGATPRIGGGEVAVLVKLLSPAGRPVQVTRDLASFWRGGYAQVRKELKGRYPRHDWPEDPLSARASRGVRR
ncbi:MAG TPA: ATP-dependent helicase HrpB [Steroidobacteraceae bacterium]|nr:ATP-dependent helicase HrpB [Steroidobacteraceae bacterium]